jgi:hypothetical protein
VQGAGGEDGGEDDGRCGKDEEARRAKGHGEGALRG